MGAGRATALVRATGRSSVRVAAMATARRRRLPDVVIVGVKRGGTTSLFRDLERHPAMLPLVPSARRLPLRENMKGVHYFDSDMSASARWYRSHFATVDAHRRTARRAGSAFTAEASPYYFFHPLAATRSAAALPEAMFVVMLRDPVERTVSHWAEQTRNGIERLSLAAALEAEDERVGDAGARLAAGEIGRSHAHEHQSYAAQSEYAASLERWRTEVGDRLVVVFSEDYYRDPATTLRTLADRLGVAPMADRDPLHRNAAPRPSTLAPSIESALVERFRADVRRLTELTGRRPPWPRFVEP